MHDQVRLSTGSESCNRMETMGATMEAGKVWGERVRAWRGRRRVGGQEKGGEGKREGRGRREERVKEFSSV